MMLSVREAKARFSEALTAAAAGKQVVVTKYCRPFVELVAARPAGPGFDLVKLAAIRKRLGIDGVTAEEAWPEHFDDPAFSRQVLGLKD